MPVLPHKKLNVPTQSKQPSCRYTLTTWLTHSGSHGELTLIGLADSEQLLVLSMHLTHPHLLLLPQRPAVWQDTHNTHTHTLRHTYFTSSTESISIFSPPSVLSRNNVNSAAPNRHMQMNSGSNLPKQSLRHHHVKSSIQHVQV